MSHQQQTADQRPMTDDLRSQALRSSGVSIAVVMSNYNHARYLAEAIESVLNQSVPANEFVIVDDASTDHSVEVIEDYARRHPVIRFVRQPKNRGGIKNVSEAISMLCSTHFVSLAADDKLLPGFFETATRLLSSHPQAGMCLCDFEAFSDDGKSRARRMRLAEVECYFSPQQVARVLYDRWPHGQGVVRTAALLEAGGYREDLRWHCDWFVSWAICARHGFCYAPAVGTAMRVSVASYSGAGRQSSQQKKILSDLVELLGTESFRWMTQPLRDANALSHFGPAILPVLWRKPAARRFLSARLLMSITWGTVYHTIARFTPRGIKRWLRRYVWKA